MMRRRGSKPSHNAWICFNAASFGSGSVTRRLTVGFFRGYSAEQA
jgi:hypothetical protein